MRGRRGLRVKRVIRVAGIAAASLACALAIAAPPTTRAIRRRVVVAATEPVQRDPIPGVTLQQQVETRIHEIYATDYLDTSFAGRRALATRLIAASE